MPAENLRIMCPNLTCRKLLSVPRTARGKMVRCRSCGTHIRVPGENGANKPAPQSKPTA